ncbi:hypothetical protein [Pseudomonas knackmussii]|uniref:hypothetical protein n=1 Tax=Pseudomonas knackmussii TaxID=65741 RepID=UPI0013639C23|nr:hypothetical protein [Pseudomonas knackmussii]
MRRVVYAALLLLASAAHGADEQAEARAHQAVFAACPGLETLQDANEIISTHSEISEALGSIQHEQLGWSKQVDISVTLADPVKSVPANWYANGQTCYFSVGRGGMVVSKKACQHLCDISPSSQPAIVKIPALDDLSL